MALIFAYFIYYYTFYYLLQPRRHSGLLTSDLICETIIFYSSNTCEHIQTRNQIQVHVTCVCVCVCVCVTLHMKSSSVAVMAG